MQSAEPTPSLATVPPSQTRLADTAPSTPRSGPGSGGRNGRRPGQDRRAPSPTRAYGSLERSFAACGLIAALATIGGAALAVQGYGPPALLALTSVALLLCLCLGNLALERVIQFQRGEVARVYVNATEAPRRAVFERRHSEPTRMEALRLSLRDVMASLRMTLFGGDRARLWAISMRRALDDRAEISRTLAVALGEDAHAIAAAATASRRAEAAIGADIDALSTLAGRAAQATTTMEDEAAGLQACVRQTTAQLRQASALAASLADNAMNARKGVAAVSEVAQSLVRAADDLNALMQRVTAAAQDSAGLEAEVRALSSNGQQALAVLTRAAAALKEDSAAIEHAVAVISDGVQAHGALGQALSEAVSRQMEDVARIAAKAGEARSDVLALQLHASDIERRDLGLGAGPAARRAVERLPAHAEAIASILRDLPSFDPAKTLQ